MRALVAAMLTMLAAPVLAHEHDTAPCMPPDDSSWLYEYVRIHGRDVRMGSSITYKDMRFQSDTHVMCVDPQIEAYEEQASGSRPIVFDSWCSLPMTTPHGTITVFGNIRMIIVANTGQCIIGSTPTINIDGAIYFAGPEVLQKTLETVGRGIVSTRKALDEQQAQGRRRRDQ